MTEDDVLLQLSFLIGACAGKKGNVIRDVFHGTEEKRVARGMQKRAFFAPIHYLWRPNERFYWDSREFFVNAREKLLIDFFSKPTFLRSIVSQGWIL